MDDGLNYDGWLGIGLFFSTAILIIFGIYGNVEPGFATGHFLRNQVFSLAQAPLTA